MAYVNLKDDCPLTGEPLTGGPHIVTDCEACPFLEYFHGDSVKCLYGEESEEDIMARHAKEDADYNRNIDSWREQ